MCILNLADAGDVAAREAAELLVAGFAEHWPETWPDLESARRTVEESLSEERICRVGLARIYAFLEK